MTVCKDLHRNRQVFSFKIEDHNDCGGSCSFCCLEMLMLVVLLSTKFWPKLQKVLIFNSWIEYEWSTDQSITSMQLYSASGDSDAECLVYADWRCLSALQQADFQAANRTWLMMKYQVHHSQFIYCSREIDLFLMYTDENCTHSFNTQKMACEMIAISGNLV